MANALVKVGPIGGFVAAVGSCVWPYVGSSTPPAEPPPRPPEIEESWLNPAFGPAADRDPFRPAGAVEDAPAVAASAPERGEEAGRAPAGARPARPDPLPDFALGATLIARGRRAAIINGKVYRQGDPVEVAGPAAGPWTLERVEARRVVVARAGRGDPVILEFPDPIAATAAPPSRSGRTSSPPAGRIDLRSALAEAGVPMPEGGLLERLSGQAGGTVPGAYRALLNLLIAPPRPSPAAGAGPAGRAAE